MKISASFFSAEYVRPWTLFLLLTLGCPSCQGRYFDNHQHLRTERSSLTDFCSSNQFGALMRRFFIDENDNGTFVARNINYDSLTHLPYLTPPVPQYLDHHYDNQQRYCSVELTTCPSCYIKLQIYNLNLTSCDNNTKCRYFCRTKKSVINKFNGLLCSVIATTCSSKRTTTPIQRWFAELIKLH
jgi:hypothetical protein